MYSILFADLKIAKNLRNIEFHQYFDSSKKFDEILAVFLLCVGRHFFLN